MSIHHSSFPADEQVSPFPRGSTSTHIAFTNSHPEVDRTCGMQGMYSGSFPRPWKDQKSKSPNSGLPYSYGVDYGTLKGLYSLRSFQSLGQTSYICSRTAVSPKNPNRKPFKAEVHHMGVHGPSEFGKPNLKGLRYPGMRYIWLLY